MIRNVDYYNYLSETHSRDHKYNIHNSLSYISGFKLLTFSERYKVSGYIPNNIISSIDAHLTVSASQSFIKYFLENNDERDFKIIYQNKDAFKHIQSVESFSDIISQLTNKDFEISCSKVNAIKVFYDKKDYIDIARDVISMEIKIMMLYLKESILVHEYSLTMGFDFHFDFIMHQDIIRPIVFVKPKTCIEDNKPDINNFIKFLNCNDIIKNKILDEYKIIAENSLINNLSTDD